MLTARSHASREASWPWKELRSLSKCMPPRFDLGLQYRSEELKWPSGKPGEPCLQPDPTRLGKPVGPGKSCDRYLNACHRGSILACNMYYVCMGAGWQGGMSLPPIGGSGADCVRGCLLGVLGAQTLSSCRCAYAQHQQCFYLCGWAPPWPFNWATWSAVCIHHAAGAPDPGAKPWRSEEHTSELQSLR